MKLSQELINEIDDIKWESIEIADMFGMEALTENKQALVDCLISYETFAEMEGMLEE